MKENYLEIIITKHETEFKAESPNFPHCEGNGETKELALNDLTLSIRNYISEMAGRSLEKMILNAPYSKVLTNPDDTSDNEHRVIPLKKDPMGANYPVFIKLKKNHINAKTEVETESLSEEFEELIQHLKDKHPLNVDMLEGLNVNPKMASEILFNVLMSLN